MYFVVFSLPLNKGNVISFQIFSSWEGELSRLLYILWPCHHKLGGKCKVITAGTNRKQQYMLTINSPVGILCYFRKYAKLWPAIDASFKKMVYNTNVS